MNRTIVLGAGLQGVSVALALAKTGRTVTLIDRQPDCLTQASYHNEGKIHLGFVYANDPTCRTSTLMLNAALSFGPLLEEWLGVPVPWHEHTATPFTYLILRESLVPVDRLFHAWDRLQSLYDEHADGRAYLGTRPRRLWWREPVHGRGASEQTFSDRVEEVVRTAELALDLRTFRQLIRARLAEASRVRLLYGHHVRAVQRTSHGFRVEASAADGGMWTGEAETVVNCLWAGRLEIDSQLGLLPKRPWVFRLKYRLFGQLPPSLTALPSLTMMLGRFGDIVNYRNGRMYASWYPACLRGWSADVTVPESWAGPCAGDIPPDEAAAVTAETVEAFDAVVPGFRESRPDSLAAGVIFSWGETDIDDPQSELHSRHEIGPEAHDGYVTVNTGKLTSAPLFARRVVEMVR